MAVASVQTSAERAQWKDVVRAYLALTKPRIIELLLITTIPAMIAAERGLPSWQLMLATMIGGMLAAGSANTFNCVYDADIDEVMRRTRRRPVPRHQVSQTHALVFASVLAVLATVILGFAVNWLSAALSLLANAFYVFVYTMWLKRRTWQNIVWGGIAGCFPPLIGWTAVTGEVALAPFAMFAIVFLWTPPHTWALAFRYRDDYAAAGVPMLPVVRPASVVATQIWWYTAATVVVSLVLWPIAHTGWIYPVVAVLTGAVFLFEAFRLWQRARDGATGAQLKAMRLFHWSNSYLALLFLAIAIDPLLS